MSYCTFFEFESTLAQTMTSGSSNPANLNKKGKLVDIGNKLNLDGSGQHAATVGTYSPKEVMYYIRQASSLVDASLSQQYVVPLRPIVKPQMQLLYDVNEYSAVLYVNRPEVLSAGDQLVLVQNAVEEIVEVEEIDFDGQVLTVEPLENDYVASITRVLRIKFPDPIPYITAKLACAMFYDKYAKAQQEPSKSEYSDILRKEATAELNNIREGRTILDGIERVGSRFVNANLYARYGLAAMQDQDQSRADQGRG